MSSWFTSWTETEERRHGREVVKGSADWTRRRQTTKMGVDKGQKFGKITLSLCKLPHLRGNMLKPKILAVGEPVPGVGECPTWSVWLLHEHTRRLLRASAVCTNAAEGASSASALPIGVTTSSSSSSSSPPLFPPTPPVLFLSLLPVLANVTLNADELQVLHLIVNRTQNGCGSVVTHHHHQGLNRVIVQVE